MALFSSFNIASSGMTAQRLRMDVISENIANVKTTRTRFLMRPEAEWATELRRQP